MAIDHDTIVRVLMQERVKLLAFAWAIVRDAHLAEDVLQEVTLAAIRKRDQIHDADHLRAWLRRSARFEALGRMRLSDHANVLMDDQMLDRLESRWEQTDAVDHGEMVQALHHCLGELSPASVRMLKLRYVEGLRGEKLAQAMNQKLRTHYLNLARIMRTVQQCVRLRLGMDTAE